MPKIIEYPSRSAIESADRYTLCKWHRFLRSPENEEEYELNKLMFDLLYKFGGFTPEISKSLGWG